MTHRTASIIGGIGRTLIALGLITLSFSAFQLWGTGLQESRAQDSLESDFEQRLADVREAASELEIPVTTSPPAQETISETEDPAPGGNDNPVITAPSDPAPVIDPELVSLLQVDQGSVLGNIKIPAIDMTRHIVEGVSRGNLREGPGHYPTSPLPGQPGNAAIAGHRTTYGEPFGNLDLLKPDDEIIVTTLQGEFRYRVMPQTNTEGEEVGHFIVSPSQVEILQDYGDNRLTLTACHPKYSARQRIVVTALLVEAPAPVIPTTAPQIANDSELANTGDELALDEGNVIGLEENALDEALGWNTEERMPTIIWALATALIAVLAAIAAKLWKRWPSYLLATPAFLLTLFVCFSHLDRFLPAL